LITMTQTTTATLTLDMAGSALASCPVITTGTATRTGG
jgi:hypothetical protein